MRIRFRDISRGFNSESGLSDILQVVYRRSQDTRLTRRIRRGKGGNLPPPAGVSPDRPWDGIVGHPDASPSPSLRGRTARLPGVPMPIVLDPDAAAVYQAFLKANRPPYEALTPAEARTDYARAGVATNPEPPELARVDALAILAPHGNIAARLYVPKRVAQA